VDADEKHKLTIEDIRGVKEVYEKKGTPRAEQKVTVIDRDGERHRLPLEYLHNFVQRQK